MRRIVLASLIALGGVAPLGCDKLISPNVTETDFALPAKSYSFDASAFGFPVELTQEVPCGPGLVMDCCNPALAQPPPDCSATPTSCEPNAGGTNVCMAQVTVAQSTMIDLGQEVPKLSSVTGLLNITIKRISYSVDANTLDVDLPDVILYMAPQGVTDPADSRAQKFGTLPAIPAMTRPAGDVVLEPNAAQVFNTFTHDIRSPFTFIAGTTLKVSKAPTGKIDLTVSGMLAASL
jgi:hypothetical protein